jgi:hypothetical protein
VLMARVGEQWQESFGEAARRLSPAERGRQFLEQARANENEVNSILTREQVGRLRQIGLQSDVAGALREPEVAAALKLTPEQRERIRGIEDAAFFELMKPPSRPGPPPPGPPPGEAAEPKQPLNARILAVLTDEQRGRWQEMTGEPFRGPITFPSFGPPRPFRKTP